MGVSLMSRLCYLILSICIGAAVLGLEVLVARYHGAGRRQRTSRMAALLAVALGALSVGNLVGGLLSERVSGWAIEGSNLRPYHVKTQ